ncbi:MAG: hypothetical protein KDD10_20355 [Phaeodactylibacter sp.]|nr:hypothetical protein [Phaeodactylibacter sp.]MCB9292884.1 hypothetical protein [Lewinellaceae bacterium]
MGLCIHYRGALTDKRAIYQLMDEVEDIAKAMNWKYTVLDEDWSQPPTAKLDNSEAGRIQITGKLSLKGISLQVHPKSEWVYLLFNASCVISSPAQVALSAEEGYPAQAQWQSVKTQFAGAEAHIAIIRLFRYLKGKYLHDLEVSDEGEYWETENYDTLKSRLDKLDRAIDIMGMALADLDKGSSEEDIVERIEKVLRDLRKRE